MTMKIFIAILLLSSLVGCAGICDSNVVRIGPNTYAASGKYGNGCGDVYEAEAARKYCGQYGRDFQVVELGKTSGDIYQSRSSTTFKCL
jgi:hypothetical protein